MKELNIHLLLVGIILILSRSTAISQVEFNKQAKAKLVRQNNPGYPANSFSYTVIDGTKNKLHGIGAKYTLLFFYNPECKVPR